jgi:hypothetical protein
VQGPRSNANASLDFDKRLFAMNFAFHQMLLEDHLDARGISPRHRLKIAKFIFTSRPSTYPSSAKSLRRFFLIELNKGVSPPLISMPTRFGLCCALDRPQIKKSANAAASIFPFDLMRAPLPGLSLRASAETLAAFESAPSAPSK